MHRHDGESHRQEHKTRSGQNLSVFTEVTMNRGGQATHSGQISARYWQIVRERLGRADISMILNRYSHVTPDRQRSAADVLDAAFREVS
jgi:hypothetical protein